MHDSTPAPFGDVTRRWSHLDDLDRSHHVARLCAPACAPAPEHIERPGLDGGACYRRLVEAALDGDDVAFGWLAASHRPLLITRGRRLLDDDPSEWGALCLELLLTTLQRERVFDPRWLRRQVSKRLTCRMSAAMVMYLRRRRTEVGDPHGRALADAAIGPFDAWPVPADLTLELERLLRGLDRPSLEGLWALADEEPLADIAQRYGLSYGALRQRVTRARQRLQADLAQYRRVAA